MVTLALHVIRERVIPHLDVGALPDVVGREDGEDFVDYAGE
ncbi:hypothetical protein A2U01_0056433 [Trifolium medium]|uniref:Uncharacterized protein n=1 Tax=Trifolium medium TaxID=97028 RepID=A0A392RGE8_9FABA|nr:hypothetical protein [Trifolium medium]